MKFGYTILYVSDVVGSLEFFEKAFAFTRRFVDESENYGELETGETTLAFASHVLGNLNLPTGYIAADSSNQPLGAEIALVTPDVEASHIQALNAGAIEIKAPQPKPWGQIVSYIRCPDGTLIEICTPVDG